MKNRTGKRGTEARRHKESILASLYDECYDKIAHYIFVRIGDRMEAQDLAGDVFLRALDSLDSYEERGVSMQAWLFKIAHNLVVDHLRKAEKRKTVPIDSMEIPGGENPEQVVETRLQFEKVAEALQQLTPAQREVISLRFFAGLTSAEAGKVLGKSSGAVREMQSSAIKALRKLVYEEQFGCDCL